MIKKKEVKNEQIKKIYSRNELFENFYSIDKKKIKNFL